MHPHLLLISLCVVCAIPALGLADELPKRKAGLWEIKMVVGGRETPMRNIQHCTDAETDALFSSNLGNVAGSHCDQPKITDRGGTITLDSQCRIGSRTASTRAVIAGDFDSAYTMTVTSPPAGLLTGSGTDSQPAMTLEAKWVGPCRQGQRPGDIIMAGGIKINVRELAIGTGTAARP